MSWLKKPDDPKDLQWWWITRGAFLATFLWFGCAVAIGVFGPQKFWDLKLNEAGDFWAGMAGPPAFLWLILGFFQQGRELRLQVDEMRQSVEQFRQQTKIFERQLLEDRKDQSIREIDKNIDDLRDRIYITLKPLMSPSYIKAGVGDFTWNSSPLYSSMSEYTLANLCELIIDRLNRLQERFGLRFIDIKNLSADILKEITSLVKDIEVLSKDIEIVSYDSARTRLSLSRVPDLCRTLRWHLDILSEGLASPVKE